MARICKVLIAENDDDVCGQHYLLKPFGVRQLVELSDKILTETVAQCVRRKRGDGSFFLVRTV